MKNPFNVMIAVVALFSGTLSVAAQNAQPGAHTSTLSLEDLRKRNDDPSKRDSSSKHYQNDNGNYTAVVASGPVHYDVNGSWVDINTKINTASNGIYAYSNTSNMMESYFGVNAQAGIMSKTTEGEVKEFISPAMYWETNGQASAKLNATASPASVSGNTLQYHDIYPAVTAKYTVLNGKRKLVYVIESAVQNSLTAPAGADYLVFEEKLELPTGWNHKTTAKGIMVNDRSGKAIYLYENPFSNEAGHEYLYEDNTVMEGIQSENFLTIKIKVKTEWLLAAGRSYPIMVDPAATVYPDNAEFWTVQMNSAGAGGTGSPAAGRASTGTWYRGAILFNTASIPVATVNSAQIALTTGNVAGSFSTEYPVGITQSKYAIVNWADDFTQLYDYVTNPANTTGDYVMITNAGIIGATNTYSIGTQGALDVASKLGSADSFFCVTLRQGWTGGAAVDRYVVYNDHTYGTTAPQLIVNYTATGEGCRPSHSYGNCAAIGDCDYVGISNVQFNTLNSTSGYANVPIGYSSFTNTTTVTLTNSYNLGVKYQDGGSPVNQGLVAAWIDWNNDKVFTANEYIGTSGLLNNNQVHTFNVTVPQTATLGQATLRVRSVLSDETLTAADACSAKDYGETEDYKITIQTNLGVAENALNTIAVFPNPTTGVVKIQSQDEVKSVAVFNLLGQKVMDVKGATVDLSSYPAGGYILSVETANSQVFTTKVIRK